MTFFHLSLTYVSHCDFAPWSCGFCFQATSTNHTKDELNFPCCPSSFHNLWVLPTTFFSSKLNRLQKKKKKSESHSDRRNFHCCTFSGPPPITNKCRQLTWHHYFSFQLHIVPIGITEKAFGGKKKKVQDSKITQDTLVFVTCNI